MPDSFVKNSKPVFGTFQGHPKRFDIRGVFKPYGTVPLPTFITNLRIKSRLTFSFDIGEYVGRITFIDAKIFGYSEVIFWNRETKQKFVYHSLMGMRKRFIPHDLEKASTSSYSKKRYTRISWDRAHGKLSVVFDLNGDAVRPSAHGALSADFTGQQFAELTSSRPNPTSRRCSALYNCTLPVHGTITLTYRDGEKKTISDSSGISCFDISRTYMKFRSHGEFVVGFSNIKGKNIAFRIAAESHDSVNTDKYNLNTLFYDGKATPLPPVVISHNMGFGNAWVIQDTENMVDLTFTPISLNTKKISALILRTVYRTIYGTFEGTVITADGEKITFKSLPGIAENYLIRL